jgi:excinuclease ABC subunit B
MERAMDECDRRRQIQREYNEINDITPTSIKKNIDNVLGTVYEADYVTVPTLAEKEAAYLTPERIQEMIKDLHQKMIDAAQDLEFEKAARLRDEITVLEKKELDTLG